MSKLKELRKQAGMSQRDLAEASDVNFRMLQYYEQGVKDINKAEAATVFKLARALGCKMEDLLDIAE